MGAKPKRPPVNTEKESPIGMCVRMIVMGSNAAIESQEKDGQTSFVDSDTLPLDVGGNEDRKILESFGVKFLGAVPGDELFQYVELPPNWKKVSTEHSMSTWLVDDKGRRRASIFYKAAFYDRRASLSLARRYRVTQDFDREEAEHVAVAHVIDCDTVIFSTPPVALPQERNSEFYRIGDEAKKIARAWLDAHFPDWLNPAAYWD